MRLKCLSNAGRKKTGLRRAGILWACALLLAALAAVPATWALFTAEVRNSGNTITISPPPTTNPTEASAPSTNSVEPAQNPQAE